MKNTLKNEVPASCAALINMAGVKICPLSGLPCRCQHWVTRDCPCLAMARKRQQAEEGGDTQVSAVLR